MKIIEHIFDLENTLSINFEYISNFIPIMNVKQEQKRKLMSNFEKIIYYFNLKKKFRLNINEISGKILINKQIIEEIRRRNEDNYLYYKDQIVDYSDNVNKKSSLIKQIQKKFNEVEIFIQRECKNPQNINKFGHWSSFSIINFMNKNESLIKRKTYLDSIKEQQNKKIKLILNENKALKKLKLLKSKSNDLIYENYIINIQNLITKKERIKEQFNILLEIISDNTFNKESIPPFYKNNNYENEKLDSLPNSLFDQNISKINHFKNDIEIETDNLTTEKKETQELLPPDNENNNENIDNKIDIWDISEIQIEHN